MFTSGAIEPNRLVVFDNNGEDRHIGAGGFHWHEAGPEARGAICLRNGFAGLVEGGLGHGVVLVLLCTVNFMFFSCEMPPKRKGRRERGVSLRGGRIGIAPARRERLSPCPGRTLTRRSDRRLELRAVLHFHLELVGRRWWWIERSRGERRCLLGGRF